MHKEDIIKLFLIWDLESIIRKRIHNAFKLIHRCVEVKSRIFAYGEYEDL